MPWGCFGMTLSALGCRHEENPLWEEMTKHQRKIKLSCRVSFSWNSGGPYRGSCHDAGQPTEQTHPREGRFLRPPNSALAGSINSTCFSPFPMVLVPLSLLRSALVQGMKRVPLVGESRRKERASHSDRLSLPLSKFPPSVLVELPWVENKRILTLNQAGSQTSLNSGLSKVEISKEQIWRKNTDCTVNDSPLAPWRLEAKIHGRCCLHLGGLVGKETFWTFNISECESQNQ